MRRLGPKGRIFGLGQADAPTAANLEFTFAVFGTAEPQTGSDREETTMLTLFFRTQNCVYMICASRSLPVLYARTGLHAE